MRGDLCYNLTSMELRDSEKMHQLNALIELAALINSSLDIAEIRKRSIEAAVKLTDAETGSLLLMDEETGELYFDVALGEKGDDIKKIHIRKGQGIAGWVAGHGETVIINDVQADPRFFNDVDKKTAFKTRSMICLPVKLKARLLGVLQVINKRSGYFVPGDSEILTALSNQVAVAIENARLYDQMRETFYATVHALADTIEKRDPYTGGHTRRVMNYSLAIGEAMGLSDKEMIDLKLSAILHDIGKIGISDKILLKNEHLTFDEYNAIIMHPGYGAEILHHIRELREIIPGVKWHHEKYDGSGYPEGLKGEAIPLIARIISVADTFDAMTTDRPYRKGLSSSEALDELKAKASSQFDPVVVNAFVKAYRSPADGAPGIHG